MRAFLRGNRSRISVDVFPPPLSKGYLPTVGNLRPNASMRDSDTSEGEPRMTMIQRLSEAFRKVTGWFRPIRRELVPAYQTRRIVTRKSRVFYVAMAALATIGYGFPLTAWTIELPSFGPVKPRKVVSAGVGYENAETSTITVKTYDAENGTILSDDTYELNIREDSASAGSKPHERIFAGGVGPGVDGLSEFTLRVYDASTGRFLWEGFLNLNITSQESGSNLQVGAHLVAPQATVTQVRNHTAQEGQPRFYLRAVDAATGQPVWSDQFSPGTERLARAERVGRAVVGQTEGFTAPSQQIEFRIRMFDARVQRMLWEDTIEPSVNETDIATRQDESAENLPAWRNTGPEEMKKDAI